MTTIPIIASAADVPGAVRHAQREVGARWYVARRAEVLGRGDLVPREWGITAAASVARKGLPPRQGRGKMGRMDPITAAGPDWDGDLHPRDRKGRFIEKMDLISIFSVEGGSVITGRGRAVGNSQSAGGEDFVHVEISDGPSKGKTLKVPVSRVESAPAAKARMNDADAADKARRDEIQDPAYKGGRSGADITQAENDAKFAHRIAARESGDKRPLNEIDKDFYGTPEGKAFKDGSGEAGPQPVGGDSSRLMLDGTLYEHNGEKWQHNTKDEKLGPKDAPPEVVADLDGYRNERLDGVQPSTPGLDTAFEGVDDGAREDGHTAETFELDVAEAINAEDPDIYDNLDPHDLNDASVAGFEAGRSPADVANDLMSSYRDVYGGSEDDIVNSPAVGGPKKDAPELTKEQRSERAALKAIVDDPTRDEHERAAARGKLADLKKADNPQPDPGPLENDIVNSPAVGGKSKAPEANAPAADAPAESAYGPAPEGIDPEAWDVANNYSLDTSVLDAEGEDRDYFTSIAESEGVDRDELVKAAGQVSDSEPSTDAAPDADVPEAVDVGLQGPSALAADYGSGSLAGRDDGAVTLSQTTQEDLTPLRDFLNVDSGDGSWASGLSTDQFQSLMDYHDNWTEDPESVPSWANEKLTDAQDWADRHNVDAFDAMTVRRDAMELGWSIEEQLTNILNGEALDEQNPNALERIADFLGNSALSNESFNPEDPEAITPAELAGDIRGFLEDFGYTGPETSGPEIDPETGEPLNDNQVRGQAITDQANETLTDPDAQRAFEDWSSAVVVEADTPEAGWDTVQTWLDHGQERYNERNARGDWRANDPGEAEAEGRAQIAKYGYGVGGKDNLEIEAIGDPREYDFGAFQVWQVNSTGRGGRGTFPTREAAQAFIDGYSEEWDLSFSPDSPQNQLDPAGGFDPEQYAADLGIDTLKTQKSDSLDFHDMSAASIKDALTRAYKDGHDGQEPPAGLLDSIGKEHLGRETLETRNSDSLDFADTSVWGLSDALQAAHDAEASPEAGNAPESASDAPGGSEAPGYIPADTSPSAGSPLAKNPYGGPEGDSPEAKNAKNVLGMAIGRAADKPSSTMELTDAYDRLEAIYNESDRDKAHKDLASIMTATKMGGKQRKRYRELLDTYKGWDSDESAKVQADAVADNLSDTNPVKERLKAKAAEKPKTLGGEQSALPTDLVTQSLKPSPDSQRAAGGKYLDMSKEELEAAYAAGDGKARAELVRRAMKTHPDAAPASNKPSPETVNPATAKAAIDTIPYPDMPGGEWDRQREDDWYAQIARKLAPDVSGLSDDELKKIIDRLHGRDSSGAWLGDSTYQSGNLASQFLRELERRKGKKPSGPEIDPVEAVKQARASWAEEYGSTNGADPIDVIGYRMDQVQEDLADPFAHNVTVKPAGGSEMGMSKPMARAILRSMGVTPAEERPMSSPWTDKNGVPGKA